MGKQAILLAGGFGTRLAHVVSDVPKPMAPIKNIPFLDYIIKTLKKNEFDSFIFLTGYKSEVIENHFRNEKNCIFVKEEKALGTGGAILNAFNFLNDDFFVINGDTFFDIDFSLLQEFSQDKECTLALRYTENISRYGFVQIDDNYKINSFVEKGNLPKDRIDGFINGGIYYFKKSVLNKFADKFQSQFISLETEIFPQLLKEGLMYGLPLGGCFIDIGIPDDYYRAQDLIPEWIDKKSKPALFIDKDGTLIVNTEYPHGRDFQIIESTINIVKNYYEKNYHIIMITNQAGIAKNKFTIEQMQDGFDGIKEYYKEQGVKFDDIEFCPYHKDGVIKEYTYDSILRKPNAGMLLKACEKLKIDLKNSIMIGDNKDIDNIKLPYLKCKILGDMKMFIKEYIKKSIDTKTKILNDENILATIQKVAEVIIKAYKDDKKILTAGNGGSAGDAQHIAGELVSKFFFDRPGLSAFSLATDTSILTAIGNDYGYENLFSRQIQANAKEGDVFIGISTSGNSKNIVKAMIEAKKKNVTTVGLVGNKACEMENVCDYIIKVPSDSTPTIQESHIMICHIICAIIEKAIFKGEKNAN